MDGIHILLLCAAIFFEVLAVQELFLFAPIHDRIKEIQ